MGYPIVWHKFWVLFVKTETRTGDRSQWISISLLKEKQCGHCTENLTLLTLINVSSTANATHVLQLANINQDLSVNSVSVGCVIVSIITDDSSNRKKVSMDPSLVLNNSKLFSILIRKKSKRRNLFSISSIFIWHAESPEHDGLEESSLYFSPAHSKN